MHAYRTLLLTYLGPLKGQVTLLAVLLLTATGLQLANPQIVRGYIDAAREGAALPALTAAALAFLGITLLGQTAGLAETYVAALVGWRATNALRADLVAHCLALDLSFHNARTPGELIERVDGDVSTLANFFSRFVVVVAGSAVLLVGILALVAREDARAGALFLGVSLVKLAVVLWSRPIGARYAAAQRQASAQLFGFLEERLNALPDIQGSGAQRYVLYRAEMLLRELFKRAERAVVVGNFLGTGRWLADSAGWVATFALVATLFARGEITLGGAYLLVQYRSMVNRPLSQLLRQLRDLQQATASVARVRELFTTSSRIGDEGRMTLPAGALAVELDRVWFAYGERETARPPVSGTQEGASQPDGSQDLSVLRDVSFTLPAGRVLGIAGRTGSGKTTISRLLVRLYEAPAGTVRVGGLDVREVRLDSLRARIGLVTQEVQLFRATLRDNLTLFDPGIPEARIAAALAELGMGEWLEALPAGLETRLGPGGTGLSAGQSQLLALARVFLRDPGVVVLDEPSSRLDPATERLIEGAVARLMAGRTAVVIAHRLETLGRVDDVLILEDGAVAEHGERERLAADPDSRFAALLRAGTLEPAPSEPVTLGEEVRA